MLTIKSHGYSDKEREILLELFTLLNDTFAEKYCDIASCEMCLYKTLCQDFYSTERFLQKSVYELKRKEVEKWQEQDL